MRFKGEGRREFAGGHGGTQVDAGIEFKVPFTKNPWFKTEIELTWADDEYMETFFGVNPAQSAASGLRQFDADAGFKKLSFQLMTGIDITENWVVGASVGYARMLEDAADSPVVDDVGSRNQFMAGLGLSYQF